MSGGGGMVSIPVGALSHGNPYGSLHLTAPTPLCDVDVTVLVTLSPLTVTQTSLSMFTWSTQVLVAFLMKMSIN